MKRVIIHPKKLRIIWTDPFLTPFRRKSGVEAATRFSTRPATAAKTAVILPHLKKTLQVVKRVGKKRLT